LKKYAVLMVRPEMIPLKFGTSYILDPASYKAELTHMGRILGRTVLVAYWTIRRETQLAVSQVAD